MRACTAELARKVDQARRARIRAENARDEVWLCPGCGMPGSDWTPGCRNCWSRHRGRDRRGAGSYDPVLAAKVRVCIVQMQMDIGRAKSKVYW